MDKFVQLSRSTLYLDVGNSEIKWQIGREEDAEVKSCSLDGFSEKSELYQVMKQAHHGLISCTSHHPRYHYLGELFLPFSVRWLTNVPVQSAFSVAYEDAGTYGIDRYLSLLAVMENAPLILVDCGSAITVDIMRDSTTHLGGWILPGLTTAKKQFGEYGLLGSMIPAEFNQLGMTTQAAIANGYHSAIIHFLSYLEHGYKNYGIDDAKLIITGGDAEHVLPNLSTRWQHKPFLVLKGLVIADENHLGK